MKTKRNSFYRTLIVILCWVIIAATIGFMASCTFDHPLLDWEIDPDPIDTVQVDTLVVDTCFDPILITDPKFVTLYIEFDILEDSILWEGGHVQSYDLGDVIEAVTPHPYTIYHKNKSWVVIIENTIDNQSFYVKVFARSNGAKVYFGAIKQGFIFAGALSFEQFRDIAINYPSVDRFNFRNTQYDSIQYIELAEIILGDCKAGRTWADFRFNPYPIDTAIINQYEAAGWNNVLHN